MLSLEYFKRSYLILTYWFHLVLILTSGVLSKTYCGCRYWMQEVHHKQHLNKCNQDDRWNSRTTHRTFNNFKMLKISHGMRRCNRTNTRLDITCTGQQKRIPCSFISIHTLASSWLLLNINCLKINCIIRFVHVLLCEGLCWYFDASTEHHTVHVLALSLQGDPWHAKRCKIVLRYMLYLHTHEWWNFFYRIYMSVHTQTDKSMNSFWSYWLWGKKNEKDGKFLMWLATKVEQCGGGACVCDFILWKLRLIACATHDCVPGREKSATAGSTSKHHCTFIREVMSCNCMYSVHRMTAVQLEDIPVCIWIHFSYPPVSFSHECCVQGETKDWTNRRSVVKNLKTVTCELASIAFTTSRSISYRQKDLKRI